MRVLSAMVLASVSAIAGCASSPAVEAAAPTRMKAAASKADQRSDLREVESAWRLHAPTYPDAELNAYIREVGLRVAQSSELPSLDWTFRVLDSTEINAHSLGDRHIAVTRGLLAHMESEAELAAVLAHEIGHVVCQHTRPTSDAWLPEWFEPYEPGLARDPLDERQADQMAATLLAATDYAPRAVFESLRSLRGTPSPGQTPFHESESAPDETDPLLIRTVRAALVTPASPDGRWERARFLSKIEGMAVGPDPREGAIRDRRYVVPWAKLAFDIPPGVETKHALRLLSMTHPESGAVVLIMPATRELTDPGSDIVSFMTDVEVRTVQGLTVRVGDFRGSESGPGRMAIIHADDARFIVMSGGKSKDAVAHSRELHQAVLMGLSRRVGPAWAQARLRVVKDTIGAPTAEDRRSCPEGTDLHLSATLNDALSTARRIGSARVKCATPN